MRVSGEVAVDTKDSSIITVYRGFSERVNNCGARQASTLTCDEIPDSSHVEVRGERITWQLAKEKHFTKWQ